MYSKLGEIWKFQFSLLRPVSLNISLRGISVLPLEVVHQGQAIVCATDIVIPIFFNIHFISSLSLPLCRSVFLLYHNSESVEIGSFLGGFPTFRIYGTGDHLGVDLG